MFDPKLGQFLEELSTELIIADPNDSEPFSNLVNILKSIQTVLKESKSTTLDETLSKIESLIQKIVNSKCDHGNGEYNTIISSIEEIISKVTLKMSTMPEDNNSLTSSDNFSKPTKKNIYHPGGLPDYLNPEDFLEFLSNQIVVLDQLETFILEFEKGNLDSSAKNIKRILHTMKGESGFLALEEVEKVCHKTEDLLSQTLHPNASEILFQVKDWLSETFIVYSNGSGNPEKFQYIIDQIEYFEKQNIDQLKDKVLTNIDALEGSPIKENIGMESKISANNSININLDRLDKLIDIIGELAIAEAMVTQNHEIANIRSQEYLNHLSVLSNITKELQDVGLSLRMIPLKTLFNRMARVARDISKKIKKQVDFTITGEGTELDKNLVDGLSDPLIHMIRNSIDHGIERDPQERINAGKSTNG